MPFIADYNMNPLKRKRDSNLMDGKQHVAPPGASSVFTNEKGPRNQAEPYRLGTVRLQVDDLTTTWSLGQNRPLNDRHVRELCQAFLAHGVRRVLPQNRLAVAASKSEVDSMMQHLRSGDTEGDLNQQLLYPSLSGSDTTGEALQCLTFEEWKQVNTRPLE